MRFACLALVALTACQPSGSDPWQDLASMAAYFPFDGLRTWEYVSTDPDVDHVVVARMRSSEPVLQGGTNTYAVDYEAKCLDPFGACVGGLERTLRWSSSEVDGVFLWAWTEGERAPVAFDPSLQLLDPHMKVGDAITMEAGDHTFTSTLMAFDACPIRYEGGPARCAHLRITDGDDDPETGRGLVGDYWAGVGLNVVGMQFPDEDGVWELATHECEGCTDDRGRW